MLNQLNKVLELTHQLSVHLDEKQYDEAETVQAKRLTLLEEIASMALPETPDEQAETRQKALEIKELEDSISSRVSIEMKQIINQDQEQKRRKRMVKAYQQFELK